ncbi:expressed unknown protein [Seminavis robusta]|uniref:Uncharacterized protein n=1 Tax=Seminavis robusta TaxID=568900 RepID=A0A9N8HN66_9STRA|nr:expressed unknown protein [Seminavis robusta]|eukprot:Sro962_g225150.1 n/a (218) ;mRNA; f:26057-26710
MTDAPSSQVAMLSILPWVEVFKFLSLKDVTRCFMVSKDNNPWKTINPGDTATTGPTQANVFPAIMELLGRTVPGRAILHCLQKSHEILVPKHLHLVNLIRCDGIYNVNKVMYYRFFPDGRVFETLMSSPRSEESVKSLFRTEDYLNLGGFQRMGTYQCELVASSDWMMKVCLSLPILWPRERQGKTREFKGWLGRDGCFRIRFTDRMDYHECMFLQL